MDILSNKGLFFCTYIDNDYQYRKRCGKGITTMSSKIRMSVSDMKNRQTGRIISIQGGPGFVSRLEAMGIREGKKIIKRSLMLGRGPVIISAGMAEVAIGYGIARKIIVEVDA
jgi:ferrous iron transport protein A